MPPIETARLSAATPRERELEAKLSEAAARERSLLDRMASLTLQAESQNRLLNTRMERWKAHEAKLRADLQTEVACAEMRVQAVRREAEALAIESRIKSSPPVETPPVMFRRLTTAMRTTVTSLAALSYAFDKHQPRPEWLGIIDNATTTLRNCLGVSWKEEVNL